MKKILVLALALAAAPFTASAQNLSHTYVEGGFSRYDIDSGSSDAEFNGGYLRGSVGFTPNLYGFGYYARGRNDEFGPDIDLDETRLGIGYAMPIGDAAEFMAELGYVRQGIEADDVGLDESANGARASIGVRGKSGERLEGWALANYVDGDEFDGEFSATIGAQVKFSPTWGLVGEAELGEDVNRLSIGVRASF